MYWNGGARQLMKKIDDDRAKNKCVRLNANQSSLSNRPEANINIDADTRNKMTAEDKAMELLIKHAKSI